MQNRPFENIQEMNQILIQNYNAVVHKNDTVYILGDISHHLPMDRANELISRLNGKKILIKGNHDKKDDLELFEEICDFKTVSLNGLYFALMHYPIKNGKPFGKDYFAVTGKTAAELVYERVNAEKPAMGLTTWKDAPDGKILKRDISVAKNYLNEKELSRLNRLVTMFIDYGELMAEDEVLMSMQDWVEQTNQILRNNRREVLEGKGKVSHDMAMKKAEKEYEIFRVKQDLEYVSEFDREVERYLKGE